MEPIDRRPGHGVQFFTHFLVIAFLVLLFIGLLGALIFVLYRIALVDRRLYSALFLLAFAGFLVFLAVKGIKRGKFTKVALKILRFFYVLLVGGAGAAAVMVYGGFAVRRPILGAACLPPLATVLYLSGKKIRIFEKIKNLYRKLN
jgi:hypothetical protein